MKKRIGFRDLLILFVIAGLIVLAIIGLSIATSNLEQNSGNKSVECTFPCKGDYFQIGFSTSRYNTTLPMIFKVKDSNSRYVIVSSPTDSVSTLSREDYIFHKADEMLLKHNKE